MLPTEFHNHEDSQVIVEHSIIIEEKTIGSISGFASNLEKLDQPPNTNSHT